MSDAHSTCGRRWLPILLTLIVLGPAVAANAAPSEDDPACRRTVTAPVVALDQPFFFNRLGTAQPGGMIYALERDVVSTGTGDELRPGEVALRDDKRPRPLVLRANEGDCLRIDFTNLLSGDAVWDQPATRWSGVHVIGMSLVSAFDAAGEPLDPIQADGTWIGTNPPGLVPPGGKISYVYKADQPGSFFLHSSAGSFGFEEESDTFDLQYPSGQMTAGLFGAVNVQPENAAWFRSQVSRDDLEKATTGRTRFGQPVIDYHAVDDDGVPVLAMLDDDLEIIYSDLTAIVAYQDPDRPNAQPGPFPEDPENPLFAPVPASPERTQPYREITAVYHQAFSSVQAFDCAYAPPINPATGERDYSLCEEDYAKGLTSYLFDALGVGEDRYAINYGSGGIGSEILANRFQKGPAGDCLGCKYEEFFLSSWPNGDPGQVVTVPTAASASLELETEGLTQKALYPDDPSNVYHSYLRDHVKYRVLQGAANFHHIHHQHAHQWLHSPNAATGHYLDSQAIGPGTSFTLEMVYNGSGNRNETVGDSIFHCHFYPHFAEGMWALWRVHDTLEEGTELADDGLPVAPVWRDGRLVQPGARALPDGEIARGTPIPAVVPLPARPMPPMPAQVTLTADGKQAVTVVRDGKGWGVLGDDVEYDPQRHVENPGFPFFIPGLAGQRAPRPPLDVAWYKERDEAGKTIIERAEPGEEGARPMDGGLPRSLITGSGAPDVDGFVETHTRLDFSKVLLRAEAERLPEDGVPVEKVAMAAHAKARHPSCLPDGRCGGEVDFRLNGMPPIAGAPFADPCGREDGAIFRRDPYDPDKESVLTRHYRGANLQLDVVFNKAGWHFPQQRILTLWDDVEPTMSGERPPQPLFLRANSRECVEYWHTNLVPSEYALDDFQVRTPTDILGQHIHLVKFDVTSSDGAANGWNYEDGTLSPGEVQERIEAINANGGLVEPDGRRTFLEPEPHPQFGIGPRGTWRGAQTTVQRWMADPLLTGMFEGDDRTIRTVFTHDHFGPSTHQQAGLYAGLLVEPEGSLWLDSETGEPMGGARGGEQVVVRSDGGPTSWRANILAESQTGEDVSFREFALEFQDMALAYPASSISFPDPLAFGSQFSDPDDPPNPPNLEISEIVRPWGESPIAPWPQVISSGPTIGAYSVNYRSEPLSLRLADRRGFAPANTWDVPEAQDYAHVFRSIPRLRPEMNVQPTWYPPLTGGMEGTDPYTPLLETYEGDRVQVRTLVGAHEIIHHFSLRGISWLAEPSFLSSGYRNHQIMGISEHFEMQFTVPPSPPDEDVDYLYLTDASLMGTKRGTWGLMRAYDLDEEKPFLEPLPNNPIGRKHQSLEGIEYCSPESRDPENGRYRKVSIIALDVENFDPGVITYMPETLVKVAYLADDGVTIERIDDVHTPIVGAEGLVYFHEDDVIAPGEPGGKWRLAPGREFEPLVIRAAAGDCIEVTLTNRFDRDAGAFNFDTPGESQPGETSRVCTAEQYRELRQNAHDFISAFMADNRCFGGNKASTWAGLYPQLVAFDPLHSSGYNVGKNPVQTPPAPDTGHGDEIARTYYWYAGKVEWNDAGRATWTPVEFGAANLLPADPIHQHSKGLYGALVIEPEGSTWETDPNTRISATVTKADGTRFRDFVMIVQDDLELSWINPAAEDPITPVPIVSAEAETAVNYSTAFLLFRLAPPAPWSVSVDAHGTVGIYDQTAVDQTALQVDQFMGGDPSTPVYSAHAGMPVRFRVTHSGGIFESHLFTLSGHGWQERPYVVDENPNNPNNDPYKAIAQRIGDNEFAEWKGQQIGVGPDSHWDFVIEPTKGVPTNGAGGSQRVPGDYLYRSLPAVFFEGGFWGIFRVGPEVPDGEERDVIAVTTATWIGDAGAEQRVALVTGSNSPVLGTQRFADAVTLHAGVAAPGGGCDGEALAGTFEFTRTDGPMRDWQWVGVVPAGAGAEATVCARSAAGGTADSPVFDRSTPPVGSTRYEPPGTE